MPPHDRWLICLNKEPKKNKVVNIAFCVGHGFESEAAPSEWAVTKFYLVGPDNKTKKLKFTYKKDIQNFALAKVKIEKEGTYLVYSVAEEIIWITTTDGRYFPIIKGKININKDLIKFTYIGWEYSKTFFKVNNSSGDVFKKVVGGLIEIVPQKDPTTLKVGDFLPIVLMSKATLPNFNIAVVALYKNSFLDKWTYNFYAELPFELYNKLGIKKENIIKIPITHKGDWFIKAFRMLDKEILCEKKYGEHTCYFFESTITFCVK